MKDVLFALLAGGLGLLLLTAGYRLARILLPLWAFFAGFTIGAAGFADAMNEGFIATTMGVVVGLIVGVVFALLAYFFYSLAVVLVGGSVGYWIGTGFMSMLGLDKGFLSATVGIVIGVIFALLTIGLNIAKYLLITLTSFSGATAIVGGILVLFNKIEITAFDYVTAGAVISQSWLWMLVTGLLVAVGILVQASTTSDYTLDSWTTEYGAPKKDNSTYTSDES